MHWVGGNRLGGGRPGGRAGAQVEAGPVQPALDRVVVDLALGQRHLLVRAHVVQREDLPADPDDRDRCVLHLYADRPFLGNVGQGAGPYVGVWHAHAARSSDRASSASIALLTRSRISGTSIWAISWPKKPVITSRRASANGMPRAIR